MSSHHQYPILNSWRLEKRDQVAHCPAGEVGVGGYDLSGQYLFKFFCMDVFPLRYLYLFRAVGNWENTNWLMNPLQFNTTYHKYINHHIWSDAVETGKHNSRKKTCVRFFLLLQRPTFTERAPTGWIQQPGLRQILDGFSQAFSFPQYPRQWQFYPRRGNLPGSVTLVSPSEEPPASWEDLGYFSDAEPSSHGTSQGPVPKDT